MEASPRLVEQGPWFRLRQSRATASDIVRHFGVSEAPVPVAEIAKAMGIQVVFSDHLDCQGMLEMGRRPRITVRNKDFPTRRRFTIAHEIGHLMLHPLGTQYRDTDFRGSEMENQANMFAGELLMPESMLRVYLRLPSAGLDTLAKAFAVSREAMGVRLRLLGVI